MASARRAVTKAGFRPTIVYDLDAHCAAKHTPSERPGSTLECNDADQVTHSMTTNKQSLVFESRFESGNLRRAVQVDCLCVCVYIYSHCLCVDWRV
jgi:hypothetical protein